MKGFVNVTLKDGLNQLLVAIDSVMSIESVDYIYSKLTLKNGKSYQLFETAEDVMEAISAAR